MFNTTTNKTEFNAPATGIIQKSNSESFFVRCHYNSGMADRIFVSKPKYDNKEVEVLQVMLIHNEWMLIELLYKNKY